MIDGFVREGPKQITVAQRPRLLQGQAFAQLAAASIAVSFAVLNKDVVSHGCSFPNSKLCCLKGSYLVH